MNYYKIFCCYRCQTQLLYNGEINNTIAINGGSFKYDIHDKIIVLGTGSLALSDMRFLYVYIDIYLYMIWDC